MKFLTTITNSVNEDEWNSTLLQNNESFSYQTTSRIEEYKDAYDSEPLFISIRNSNSKLVGQLAASIHRKYLLSDISGISKSIVSKLKLASIKWYYGPVIHDNENREEILSCILDALNKIGKNKKISLINGSSPPSKKPILESICKKYGFSIQKWSTYFIDLNQNMDDLYASLDKKTRYDIRKSEKNELSFEIPDDLASIKEYAKIKIKSKKDSGLPIKDKQLFPEEHFKQIKNGYERLFLVRYHKEVIAGLIAGTFNKNVVQASIAVQSRRDLLPGIFLTWNAIKWCNKMKFSTFDMGGFNPDAVSEKEKAIDFFKSKWGGEKVDFYNYSKILDNTKVKFSRFIKNPTRFKTKIKSKIS